MLRYSGRFLVFHNNGTYLGQVKFEKMESGFRQEQLKMVCMSDNVKYFVFDGPVFTEKVKKPKKDKGDQDGKDRRQSKAVEAPSGLLGGLMSARKEKEKQSEKEKKKTGRIYYVFKLECTPNILTGKLSWKFVE